MARIIILLLALTLMTLLGCLASRKPRSHAAPTPPAEELSAAITALALRTPCRRTALLRADRRVRRLLTTLLRSRAPWSAMTLLREHGRDLTMLLMTLEADLRRPLRLPADAQRTPRMLLLAQELVRHDSPCDGPALLQALQCWHDASATTFSERMALPLCLRAAVCQRLLAVLHELRYALREAQRGYQLALRLRRSRKPIRRLVSAVMTPPAAEALLLALRDKEDQELPAAVEDALAAQGTSAAELMAQHTRQQAALAEDLLDCLTALRSLATLNWPEAEEPLDPLHLHLAEDPSALYPLMTPESRLDYRRQAAWLAQLFHRDEAALMSAVLRLCRVPDADGVVDHPGWYLTRPAGMRALQQYLKVRHGRLRLWIARHWQRLRHIAQIVLNTLAAFLLLHAGQSLWLLPPLLLVTGQGVRFLLAWADRLFPAPPVPQLSMERVPEELRTLVVIPAVLRSRSQAIPTVRRLLLASHAMPEGAVDFLLLADWDDSLTATSGDDAAISFAASKAIEAIDRPDRRFLYLHRSRVYDRRLHCYAGQDGRQGAMASLRQLIAEGSCPDAFDEASVPPSFFRNRYAYVLALPADATPAPGMLLPLIGALEHPLNRLHSVIARPRGIPDPESLRTRMGQFHGREELPGRDGACCLFDPRAVHEQANAAALPERLSDLVLEELCGCVVVADSRVYPARSAAMTAWVQKSHRRALQLWQQISWLLPWQSAESGVQRSPLPTSGRRRLRLALNDALLPAAQLLTLLLAVLAGHLPLLLAALLLPELPTLLPLTRHSPMRFLSRLVMLPLRAWILLDALWRGLWSRLTLREPPIPSPGHSDTASTFSALENWSQSLSALAIAGASFLPSPVFLPGLILAALFACFPLMHTHLDRPIHRAAVPTESTETSLMDMAHATWRYFEETVSAATHHLPPESYQLKPWRGTSAAARPEDIGLYLLSCLAARELDLLSATDMARRIAQLMDTLEQLSLHQGLPFQRYDLQTLAPAEPRLIDTAQCGVLCACLLCAAQGLRASLPDTLPELHDLPSRLDAFAAAMDLRQLYDPAARLFHPGIDGQTGAPAGPHLALYASESLLTSFVAVMRGEVPAGHLDQLSRAQVRTRRGKAMLSLHGSASEYLLPLLLLPLTPGTPAARTVSAVIRSQRTHGTHGMFGVAECAMWRFDGQMNYLRRTFGLPELALTDTPSGRILTPYAAALCLPFDLPAAHDSLTRMLSHGLMGHLGYFDCLDSDPARLPAGAEEQLVQCHLSGHQAMLLCSLCNALTSSSLVRTFMAIPAAAAHALLLRQPAPRPLTLPLQLIHPEAAAAREPSFRRQGRLDILPLDAHVIGSPDASLTLTSHGCGTMRARGFSLTRFTGDPTAVEGLQFYLHDGLQTYRIGDPALAGETVFAEGCIRLTQLMNGLQCTLTAMADPASGTFLHTLEITNLTPGERFLEVADCLIPGFAAPDEPLRAARPSDRVLTLTRPGSEPLTLCHVLTTADPLIALAALTDRAAFQGRGCTMHRPLALGQPMADAFLDAPVCPCAAFRTKLSLGARGRTMLIFTTRLLRPGEAFSLESLTPRTTDLPGLLTLSRLACRAAYDALQVNQGTAALLSRTAGVMLWHSQPHQGAITPLALPPQALEALSLSAHEPLMTVLAYTAVGASLALEAAQAVAWLNLSGQAAQLCVLCMGDDAQAARQAVKAALSSPALREHARIFLSAELEDGQRTLIEAASRLLLYEGAGDLRQQLDALEIPLPAPVPAAAQVEAPALPAEPLRSPSDLGGFQEQTDDYVLRLAPGEYPPAAWEHQLAEGDLSQRLWESGPGPLCLRGQPLAACTPDPLCPAPSEMVLLRGSGVFSLLPLDGQLPFRIQHSPSQSQWHTIGYGLDMTLTLALASDAHCALRTLRLKNLTAREKRLTLTVAVPMERLSCLTPISCGLVATLPGDDCTAWLVTPEHSMSARRMSLAAFAGLSGGAPCGLDHPGEDVGTVAILDLPVVLHPGASQSLTWLLGMSAAADDLELALHRVTTEGASALMRQSRQRWSHRLSLLTLSSPEDSFNLLMNRILPHQARLPQPECQAALLSIHGLTLSEPQLARSALLSCASCQHSSGSMPSGLTGERLLLPLTAARYVTLTGDAEMLNEPVPFAEGDAGVLYDHCMRALTSIRLGRHGLPLMEPGEFHPEPPSFHGESLLLAFVFASALNDFSGLAQPDDRADILDVLHHLTAAIDRSGWDGRWYLRGYTAAGMPLGSAQAANYRIDGACQAWAVLALGDTPRTREALDAAWQTLFDPRADVLRTIDPPTEELPQPPGHGFNGGQETLAAVWMLEALCRLQQYDRAWALLAALEPVHRDPAVFRLPPYRLPGSLTAQGQGLTADTSGAAGCLYAIVLEHLLGLQRHGDQLRLTPHLPPAWDALALTLRLGTSTWHIHASRDVPLPTCDGDDCPDGWFTLTDDGRIHQLRTPVA